MYHVKGILQKNIKGKIYKTYPFFMANFSWADKSLYASTPGKQRRIFHGYNLIIILSYINKRQ